jgi:hypothetical protein
MYRIAVSESTSESEQVCVPGLLVRELAALRVVNRRGTPFGLSRVFEMLHGGRKAKQANAKRRRASGKAPRQEA